MSQEIKKLNLTIVIEHEWGEHPKHVVKNCPTIIDIGMKINEIIDAVNEQYPERITNER